jgi:SAM-dependent methyltransferase
LAQAVLRRITTPRATAFALVADALTNARALEIGGPSPIFGAAGLMPVYTLLARVDNCNFGQTTVWEQEITTGDSFRFDRRKAPGTQWIAEACALPHIEDGTYDAVLSSHSIEHTANPLRALEEWKRILRDGGHLVLVVPHKEGTFDHRRPVTALSHLVDDLERGTGEDDLTHLPEVLALHDLSRDPGAGERAMFEARSQRNHENRCIHHHVFDTALVAEMLDRAGFRIRILEAVEPHHIVAVARKEKSSSGVSNRTFLHADADYRQRSPFATDRPSR